MQEMIKIFPEIVENNHSGVNEDLKEIAISKKNVIEK